MTAPGTVLETEVRGVEGTWPDMPEFWSYSSLRDAEECPRRWALARATYPAIWDRPGYPPRPTMPALAGQVIHGSLDAILRTFYQRGCSSIADPAATDAVRNLGGYSALIERQIENQLEEFKANPRTASRVAALGSALQSRTPEIRQRVQSMVARATLAPTSAIARTNGKGTHMRTPLRDGSHPEVPLRASDLRLFGRADVITVSSDGCSILDYKTGAPDEHHAEQLRMYQLLWSGDAELNPAQAPVVSLTLSYATHDVTIEPLSPAELDSLAGELVARVRAVEDDLAFRPPPARPEPTMCRLCDVRHLCDEYWASSAVVDDSREFVDRQGTIVARNGPRSWIMEIEEPNAERALLRTPTEDPSFAVGDQVRLLDVVVATNEDAGEAVVTITRASEVFQIDARG